MNSLFFACSDGVGVDKAPAAPLPRDCRWMSATLFVWGGFCNLRVDSGGRSVSSPYILGVGGSGKYRWLLSVAVAFILALSLQLWLRKGQQKG